MPVRAYINILLRHCLLFVYTRPALALLPCGHDPGTPWAWHRASRFA